jgi:hypothetical protein
MLEPLLSAGAFFFTGFGVSELKEQTGRAAMWITSSMFKSLLNIASLHPV